MRSVDFVLPEGMSSLSDHLPGSEEGTEAHCVVRRTFGCFSLDERLTQYIINNLGCSYATISVGGLSTGPIPIGRGVKQGDPLSPILFNLVFDELFCDLYKLPAGLSLEGERFIAFGYADDIVLMSSSRPDQQILVRRGFSS